MHPIAHHAAMAVYKRALGDAQEASSDNQPSGKEAAMAAIALLIVANVLLSIPLHIFMNYTLAKVLPVLAIVESEEPPAYEPLALDDDNTPKPFGASVPAGSPQAVSSSLRSCYRALRSGPGFRDHLRASLRGLACYTTEGFLGIILFSIFLGTLGPAGTPIATLLACLCLVQFSTAWVHIIITPSSSLSFLQRLPPFKSTFTATWKPIVLVWVAAEIARWTPFAAARVMGTQLAPYETPLPKDSGKQLIAVLLGVVVFVFTVVPASIILVRVQASLLPPDEETLVPFDRSFSGKLAPAITGGGAVSIKDAWSTFSRDSLVRLAKLYLKIFGVQCAYALLFGAFIGAQLAVFGLVGRSN